MRTVRERIGRSGPRAGELPADSRPVRGRNAMRSRLLALWRAVPLWARLVYATGWLLSSVWFGLMYALAGAGWSRIDLLIVLPLLLGAVWPITLTGMLILSPR